MKTDPRCIPCFFQQAINLSKIMKLDENILKKILKETGLIINDITFEETPAEIGRRVYSMISQITGVEDPYKSLKRESIETALGLYPDLKEKVENSNDKLLSGIKYAVAGNIIDFGVGKEFDIHDEIDKAATKQFAIFDYPEFKESLINADSILYIADNAGESVFDRLLIEQLHKPVLYVVREKPIINDLTYEDAVASGIPDHIKIISSGVTAPGTILKLCSDEFIEIYNNAEMIISKGQGNYEGLSGEPGNIFFLLKAKCECVSEKLNVPLGSLILKKSE
ncbi:DUF89 family protein [Candidatus Dependentiae bacterium]|nr:DUF89 family protein [Candidatus Dependentiae bacterium]